MIKDNNNNNLENTHNIDESKFIAIFPFIKEDVNLIASVEKTTGKQQLIIQKVNKSTGKIELQDSLDCIHTALFNIDSDGYEQSQSDAIARQQIYAFSLEKRGTNPKEAVMTSGQVKNKIDLEPSETFLAFKSWVQGIAEAGMGAFELQTNIELEGSLLYPISKFLLRFFTKVDPEFIPFYIQKVQKECVFENQQHDPCYISNLMPILSVIVELFNDIQTPFQDAVSIQIQEYFREIREIHPPSKLFESDPRFGIFLLQNNDINALLRICIALRKIIPREEKLHNFRIESGIRNSFIEVKGRITGLDLSENQIKTYLPEISKLTALEELDLTFNELDSLPNSLGNLEKLRILSLSRNKLHSLPITMKNFHELERLHLSSNKIVELPGSMIELKRLAVLNIERNELDHIPECIYDLNNLMRLNFNDNYVTYIDEKITNLHQLQGLYLANNKLTSLPKTIGKLEYLAELNLSGNSISSLPITMSGLGSLQELNLNGNLLGKDSTEGRQSIETIKNIHNLIALRINHNSIREVPESIMELEHLQILDLEGNRIEDLPYTIGALQNLKILNLDGNSITDIPESYRDLQSIEKIYLRQNKIVNLSPYLGELKTLSELIVVGNKIERLDEDLMIVDFLSTLDLTDNPICETEQYFIIQISLILGRVIQRVEILQSDKNCYCEKEDHIIGLNLTGFDMKRMPKSVLNLKLLSQLVVNGHPVPLPISFEQ